MAKRQRDNQRAKLYKAEREAFKGKFPCDELHDWSVEDCQRYVDKIQKSKWWKKRCRFYPRIIVGDGRGHRRAVAYHMTLSRNPGIALPLWSRKEWVILHELAHHLVYGHHPNGSAAHGREFAKEFLALVRRWLGPEEAKALKAAFKANRVKSRVG